ncbi:MAG: hypothetical protein M3Q97_00810 [Bacteroidota bacterium]|nr:hypothetical protein [Bacteroidota bacterium]
MALSRNILFLSLLVLASCRNHECPYDENQPAVRYIPLSEEVKKKIAYIGNETLRYVHSVDSVPVDTMTVYGSVRNYTITEAGPWVGECTSEEIKETVHFSFKNGDNPDSIVLKCVAEYPSSGFFHFYFRKYTSYDTEFGINWEQAGGYHPELYLNGRYWYKVNVLYGVGQYPSVRFFYTTKDGIIRIEDRGANPWHVFDLIE